MKESRTKRNLSMGLCAVAILAALITGGAVWTQDEDTEQDAGHQNMASRVAEILDLGEEEAKAAFQQTSKEMRDDRVQKRMDRLVEKGEITEEEAVEAVEWYQSRPESIGPGHSGSRMKGMGRHRTGSSFGGFGLQGKGRFAHNKS